MIIQVGGSTIQVLGHLDTQMEMKAELEQDQDIYLGKDMNLDS